MRPQVRQLVKDGFLVEVSEGTRKLRHVFLFTDLLLCAKMKKTAVGYENVFPLNSLSFTVVVPNLYTDEGAASFVTLVVMVTVTETVIMIDGCCYLDSAVFFSLK